jgi:hypothetical protein
MSAQLIEAEAVVLYEVPSKETAKKLEILKPDVIMEAISVELKLMAKLEKDIQNLACKIAEKKKEIVKHKNVIRALGTAQKLKAGN